MKKIILNGGSAWITDGWLVISGLWTIGIKINQIKEYLQKYSSNTNPDYGFCNFEDKVILTHQGAKMMLSKKEFNQLKKMIYS